MKGYPIYIWKKAPLLRVVLPFMAGILLQYYGQFSLKFIYWTVFTCIVLYFPFQFMISFIQFKLAYIRGLIMYAFILAGGMFIAWKKDLRNDPLWYGSRNLTGAAIIVRIEEPPIKKPKSFKAWVSVRKLYHKSRAEIVKGPLIVYFARDSASERLVYGDIVLIHKDLERVKNPGNPGEFDYAGYLADKQIYHQVFVQKRHWQLLDRNKGSPFFSVLFRSRDYVIRTLETYISGYDEAALAKALLIGYRHDLERDVIQAYGNAGVVHLIAISGLHIGLVYGLLLWISIRIPFLKRLAGLRLMAILCGLWFFALLTGASPSVLRAAVMFTFIIAGSFFKKHNSVFNSLSASALVLLLLDPFVIWNVGFQLSYLAVLGIVILYNPIHRWLYFKNRYINYFWEIVSVSIAAQVFTIPVCIYYFHQLPLLFIFSNLVAIPLTSCALWGSIALILLSVVPFISLWVGKVVSILLYLMNLSVWGINQLPFVIWENFHHSVFSVLMLYVIFFCLLFWCLRKNMTAFRCGLLFWLLFVGNDTYQKWKAFNQRLLVVYNIPSGNAINFIYGNRYRLIAGTEVTNDRLIQNFHLKPVRISLRLKHDGIQNGVVSGSYNFFQFLNKKIVIIDSSVNHLFTPQKIKADYIIISGNPDLRIRDMLRIFDAEQFIFTGSNPMWKIREWKKECEELHLRFHAVSEQGAFVMAF